MAVVIAVDVDVAVDSSNTMVRRRAAAGTISRCTCSRRCRKDELNNGEFHKNYSMRLKADVDNFLCCRGVV